MSAELSFDAEELIERFDAMNKVFKFSCKQLVHINNTLSAIMMRYNRTLKDRSRTHRYRLRLQIASVEGFRTMLYDYTCRYADELDQLERHIRELEAADDETEMAFLR